MTLKKRLDRLEGGGMENVTVFLTTFENGSGEAETWHALIVNGWGRTEHLSRGTGETEADFRARIDGVTAGQRVYN